MNLPTANEFAYVCECLMLAFFCWWIALPEDATTSRRVLRSVAMLATCLYIFSLGADLILSNFMFGEAIGWFLVGIGCLGLGLIRSVSTYTTSPSEHQ